MPVTFEHSHAPLAGAAAIIAALDSPLRLEIIYLLAQREHYVHELVSQVHKSQPLVSQHLRVLKRSGIVDSERTGREVTYRLARPKVLKLIRLAQMLAESPAER